MDYDVYDKIRNDVRSIQGLQACMNCGICTAICPAAEFYEYDPRSILTTVQSGNKAKIYELLESEEFWYCGQCLSCKTRCPRGNCPGMIISVLRYYSQQTGAFMNSKQGRKQYLITKTIGQNILNFGYCIHPTTVYPEDHPEQGTMWQWGYQNMDKVYAQTEANLDGDGPRSLRKFPVSILEELKDIFAVSGGIDFLSLVEEFSQQKAIELGFTDVNGSADMVKYTSYITNE